MALVEKQDIDMVKGAVENRETRTALRKHLDSEEGPFVNWLNASVAKVMGKLEKKGVELQPSQTSELGSQIYFIGILGYLVARTAMIRQLGQELGMDMDPDTMEISLTPSEKERLFREGKLPAKYYDFDPEILGENPTIAKAVEKFQEVQEEMILQEHLSGVIGSPHTTKTSKSKASASRGGTTKKKTAEAIVKTLEV